MSYLEEALKVPGGSPGGPSYSRHPVSHGRSARSSRYFSDVDQATEHIAFARSYAVYYSNT